MERDGAWPKKTGRQGAWPKGTGFVSPRATLPALAAAVCLRKAISVLSWEVIVSSRAIFPAFALAISLLAAARTEGEETPPQAAAWIPEQAVAALEITRPDAILDPLLAPGFERFVKSLPGWAERERDRGFRQFSAAVQLFEARIGTDWRTALRKLLGRGAALALGPSGESLLIVDAQDARILAELHDFALGIARAEALKENAPERVASEEYGGATTWTLGPEEFHAIVGTRLLLSNRREVLRRALDLKAQPGSGSLEALPAYRAAAGAAPKQAAATLFVNLERVRALPGVQASLAQGRDPMGSLLFGRALEELRSSAWLLASLLVDGNSVALEAAFEPRSAADPGAFAYATPPANQAAAPNFTVPRGIAAWTLWRDLGSFYARKDELFPERTSGLIFFENMMGIFFSGMHLAEEVFGELGPEIRAVVAAQEYDPEIGEPEVRLPAFAFVFRMKDPKKFAAIAEEAWQKAIGLINFTSGQRAEPGMTLKQRVHEGCEFTVAAFRPPGERRAAAETSAPGETSAPAENARPTEKSPPHMRYNFSPSFAAVGEHLILSSAAGLTKDLISALKSSSGPAPLPAGTDFLFEISGRPLKEILEANRANLVRQNMLEKGTTEAEAEAQIGALIEIAGRVRSLRLASAVPEGRTKARLEVEIEP